jgi:hypothetical protein
MWMNQTSLSFWASAAANRISGSNGYQVFDFYQLLLLVIVIITVILIMISYIAQHLHFQQRKKKVQRDISDGSRRSFWLPQFARALTLETNETVEQEGIYRNRNNGCSCVIDRNGFYCKGVTVNRFYLVHETWSNATVQFEHQLFHRLFNLCCKFT